MTRRGPLLAALFLGVSAPLGATTLDEAIDAALAHAPEIAAMKAGADVAQAHLREAKAGSLPSATLSGSVGVGRLDPGGFFGLNAANVTPRAAQITVEQPLYAGGRIKAGIAQAQAGTEAARAGEKATRSETVAAVAQAYGDVLASRRLVALQQGLRAQMIEIGRQAQLRFKAGESPSTDVAQAAARLAEAEAALAQAEGMVVSANARFTNLTGLSPDGLDPLPASPALPESLEAAMEAALSNSPWLGQAKAGVAAAEAAQRGAKAEALPVVGAFAEGAMVRDQFFPDYRADSATVGLRARWPIFNPGIGAKISAGKAGVRAAQARLDAATAQTREAVISAYQGVRTATLVEQASNRQAEAAARARDSVAHEVRVGIKPQLDLLDAEREATAAAATQARAATDRIVAAYRLLSLIGR